MPYYYKLLNPESENPPEPTQQYDTTQTHTGRLSDHEQPARDIESEEPSREEEVVEPVTEEQIEGIQGWQETDTLESRVVTVETPLYIAEFSTEGARIISFKLKEYSNRRGGITEIIMLNRDGGYYPNAYLEFYRMGLSTDELLYEASAPSLRLSEGGSGTLVFTARLKNGGLIRNIYSFNGDNYRLGFQTESEGMNLDDDYYFVWDGNVNITEPDTVDDLRYTKAYAMMGGELEKLDAPGRGEKRLNPNGSVEWIAVRSKYFIIGIIPEGNSAGIDFVASKSGAKTAERKEFNLAVKMEKSSRSLDQHYTLYLGPIDSKRLSTLDVDMRATMSWGMAVVKPFSIASLWAFKQLHAIIPNYGVVIVVFSILVKILLWPLTHKSYVSMRKMSKLQPLIKELREKYKEDPQKMQKATAQLYKEHKVNPLGGCLPTLLQMPLLFALFIVFRSTIELRGEPFMLWITDLSLPDTIFNLGFSIPLYGSHVTVLPILMGISTYYQSKTTMTDPNQKMMIYFMPIFLVLMFNNFPSGLTLYYTLFNVLSYVQQKMVKPQDEVVVEAVEKKKK